MVNWRPDVSLQAYGPRFWTSFWVQATTMASIGRYSRGQPHQHQHQHQQGQGQERPAPTAGSWSAPRGAGVSPGSRREGLVEVQHHRHHLAPCLSLCLVHLGALPDLTRTPGEERVSWDESDQKRHQHMCAPKTSRQCGACTPSPTCSPPFRRAAGPAHQPLTRRAYCHTPAHHPGATSGPRARLD